MFSKQTKILVVDDMKTMRMVMKKCLKTLGFENVEEADDGDVAWQMMEQAITGGKGFQLVLSDWNMPRMKGIDLLRNVRGHIKMRELPFVLVTAESEKSQIMEAVKLGVSQYIMKPFTPDTIKDKLGEVAKKHKIAA